MGLPLIGAAVDGGMGDGRYTEGDRCQVASRDPLTGSNGISCCKYVVNNGRL